jgi:hypothetical protein
MLSLAVWGVESSIEGLRPHGKRLTADQQRIAATEFQDRCDLLIGQCDLMRSFTHGSRPDGQRRTRAPRINSDRTKNRFSPDKSTRVTFSGAWSRLGGRLHGPKFAGRRVLDTARRPNRKRDRVLEHHLLQKHANRVAQFQSASREYASGLFFQIRIDASADHRIFASHGAAM